MGELHVRGPCVARSYFRNPAEADKFTMDGWFRTGDVVTIDPEDTCASPTLEGPDQERRRVDQLGGRRERADGPSSGQGSGGGGGAAREVVRASGGLRRPQGRGEGGR